MARPRLQDEDRLAEVVHVRMSTAELNHVRGQAEAAGLSVSAFLRRRAMGYVVPAAAASRRTDPALVSELNRVGVNVNQLARATHTGRDFVRYWREVGAELTRVLERIAERELGEAVCDESDHKVAQTRRRRASR